MNKRKRFNMKKGCLFTSIGLLAFMSVAMVYYFVIQQKKDPTIYETTKPEINDIIKKAVATGSIKPRKEINIKPQVSGVVEKLYVEAGQIVEKGQKLAKIKLIPSEININSAQSNVELSKLRLRESERELVRQRNIFKNKLDVQQARASSENANKEEQRQKELFEEGVISETDYLQFKLDAQIKKNTLENAEISSTNSIRQSELEVEIRKQELQAAVDNLQLLREGVTQNSKQVSNVIVSTVTGMVLDTPVEEGGSVIERNTFNEGTSVAVIADMKNIIFEGKVDESDVGKLREGMPLILTVGAINEEKFEGILEFVSPKGIEEEGTVKFVIKAAIKNSGEGSFLRAGYSANADIILNKKEDVVTINERDLIMEKDKYYVQVETSDQEYEKREVELGISDGILTEITSKLDTSTVIKVQIEKSGKSDQ
jgi:HlyD family secretion protein